MLVAVKPKIIFANSTLKLIKNLPCTEPAEVGEGTSILKEG